METIKGLKSLLGKLKDLEQDVGPAIEGIVESNAGELSRKAQELAPVNKSLEITGGDLQQSIRPLQIDNLTWKILANATGRAPYAPLVEYGTGPHLILPKKGKFLKFKINGKDVFTTKVNHPGTRPQPFMFPAFEIQKGKYLKDLEDLLDSETKKI